MHLSFEKAAQHPEIVDGVIQTLLPGHETKKFTKVFHNLFPVSMEHNQNMKSFLTIFKEFRNKNITSLNDTDVVNQIYEKLGIPKTEDGVYQFWTYLIQIYQNIRISRSRPNFDNIFAFMNEFPIHDTRVVIIGQDPSPQCESSGFAFHGSTCQSTKTIIDFLNEEFKLVDRLSNNGQPTALSDNLLNEQMDNCYLNGWIKQGVLMINSKLTFGEDLWLDLTDFIIKYLSDNFPHIAFILSGGSAANKENLINKRHHLVVGVYHPVHPSQELDDLRWDVQLPFLNANFFFYQVSQEMKDIRLMDWKQFSTFDKDQYNIPSRLKFLFEHLLSVAKQAPQSTSKYAGEFVHTNYRETLKLERLECGYYVIKQLDPYASLHDFKDYLASLVGEDNENEIYQLRNNIGRTLLHQAINRLHVDHQTLKRLVPLSGDITAVDNFGKNMIMTASKKGVYPSLIRLMIKFGVRRMTSSDSKQNCSSLNETSAEKEAHDTSADDQAKENVSSMEEAPVCKRPKI